MKFVFDYMSLLSEEANRKKENLILTLSSFFYLLLGKNEKGAAKWIKV